LPAQRSTSVLCQSRPVQSQSFPHLIDRSLEEWKVRLEDIPHPVQEYGKKYVRVRWLRIPTMST
jgi:hypothetical protein